MVDNWESLFHEQPDDDDSPSLARSPPQAPLMVCIRLISLRGQGIGEMERRSEITVNGLKHEIDTLWGIPSESQKLIVSGQIVSDYSQICECLGEGETELQVILMVCMEPLLDLVAGSDKRVRLQGIAKLQQFVERGPEGTLYALNVDDPRPLVRREIVGLLERALKRGNARARSLLYTCLEHLEDDVRICAIKALAKCRDHGASDLITALLQQASARVYEETLIVLPMLMEPGNAEVIDIVMNLLQHPDENVRCEATRTLPELTSRGDRHIIDHGLTLMDDTSAGARSLAWQVLTKVMVTRDPELWDLIANAVQDADDSVRAEAWHALKCLAQSDEACCRCALEVAKRVRTEQPHGPPSEDATLLMVTIASFLGDQQAADILHELFVSGDTIALCRAGVVNVHATTPSLVAAVVVHAQSPDTLTRGFVVQALKEPNLVKHDRELAIQTLHALQKDIDANVQYCARHALLSLERKV